MSVDEIHALTEIDRWFLHAIEPIVADARAARSATRHRSTPTRSARRSELGFCDRMIGTLTRAPRGEHAARSRRATASSPHLAQIDTLAAEFPAETNYLYSSYHATRDRRRAVAGARRSWCSARAPTASARASSSTGAASTRSQAAPELGYETIMLNYNPETVSTDYDVCDQLIFDEISFETVLDIYEREQPVGVVVSMGGQLAEQPRAAAAPGRRADPRHRRREHRHGRGSPEVLRAPRRARHRPAALGARRRRRRRRRARRARSAASRCSCARATCSPARR